METGDTERASLGSRMVWLLILLLRHLTPTEPFLSDVRHPVRLSAGGVVGVQCHITVHHSIVTGCQCIICVPHVQLVTEDEV